jgi:hypothetical protein
MSKEADRLTILRITAISVQPAKRMRICIRADRGLPAPRSALASFMSSIETG